MKKLAMTSLASMMALHFAAFQTKLSASVVYEQRDDPSIIKLTEAIDKIATTFDEYKKTNDARIEALKEGKSTSDMDAKLAKMDQDLAHLTEVRSKLEKLEVKLARPGAFTGSKGSDESKESAEYKEAFLDWVRKPQDPECQQRCAQAQAALMEHKKAAGNGREKRAAQTVTTTGAAGGFGLPEQIESNIARLSVDMSDMRSLATVRTVGTTDYKELFDIGGAGFEWIGETDTRNQTNSPDLREVVPTFGMASAKPQASEESLDDLYFDVESWLIDSASESIAQGEGTAHVLGNGLKKPTGFLAGPTPVATTDATRAFGTLQFIASGQAAALPTNLDIMNDLVYSLRARYRRNAKWTANRMSLSAFRKYKNAEGMYLWQPSLVAGQPDLFMGYPVIEMEDMPNVAANAFPVAFGDFKEGYLIVDRVGMRMTRDEITTPGFVKFYIRKRTGGCLRNTQAIKLLKIST